MKKLLFILSLCSSAIGFAQTQRGADIEGEAAGTVDLWEISGVASGMYVFRVRVKDNNGNEDEVEGKVVVVR